MKFTKIGVGFPTTSKTGKKYINLRLDEDAMKAIYPDDLKKICLFESKSKNGNTYYQVTAPMKDDYEPRTQTPAPVGRTQGR